MAYYILEIGLDLLYIDTQLYKFSKVIGINKVKINNVTQQGIHKLSVI